MAGTDKAENGLIWNGEQLDREWVFLILQAKEAGLTVEEIQELLKEGDDGYIASKGVLLTGTSD
ncbi:anti-repressor SinI family protein [Alicyclobacillus mengziensis]|uniref:Anti-repressor SinI family protein n=1 Tax=Alicyclobacillus mengziensis TaxID=2931921 RepID=A0A9X7VUS7_9BACL|nr:anti-repressor SinI family protein [Alicyclobacillus mengziensis]QSO45523.1 anti-repressor SinI family protein [Alicyclobacillus mengziensis]